MLSRQSFRFLRRTATDSRFLRSLHRNPTTSSNAFFILFSPRKLNLIEEKRFVRWCSNGVANVAQMPTETVSSSQIPLNNDKVDSAQTLTSKANEVITEPAKTSTEIPTESTLLTSENNLVIEENQNVSTDNLSAVGQTVNVSDEVVVTQGSEMLTPSMPSTVDAITDLSQIISEVEPSLVSQGLGGWTPPGMIQTVLEFMHINCYLPWWITIVVGTCVARVLLFPLVITSQRNIARLNNHMPQMQMLQLKMTEARQCGNALLATKYAEELMLFMQEKKISPFKNLLVPLAQAPIFVSFFFGLRSMANLPLESFKTGGIAWFANLTVPDPYYILPIITSATLYFTLKLGAEGSMQTTNFQLMHYVLKALPIIIFPFTMNFPSAVLCYWVTSNFLSLGTVALLRIEPVRQFFKIERLIRHDPDSLPIKKKGFREGFKESISNMKIVKELEDRQRLDEMQFRKAGMGPIQKTYATDPTKQSPAAAAIAKAKPRD